MSGQINIEDNGILNSSIDIDGTTLKIEVKGTEISYRLSEERNCWSGWKRVDEALKAMRLSVRTKLETSKQTRETLQQLKELAAQPESSE
jgi:hypothetical protein